MIITKNKDEIIPIIVCGITPLHIAVKKKSEKIVLFLLKANANPLIRDENQVTPFDLANKLRLDSLIFVTLNNAVVAIRSREEFVVVDVDVDDAKNGLPHI